MNKKTLLLMTMTFGVINLATADNKMYIAKHDISGKAAMFPETELCRKVTSCNRGFCENFDEAYTLKFFECYSSSLQSFRRLRLVKHCYKTLAKDTKKGLKSPF